MIALLSDRLAWVPQSLLTRATTYSARDCRQKHIISLIIHCLCCLFNWRRYLDTIVSKKSSTQYVTRVQEILDPIVNFSFSLLTCCHQSPEFTDASPHSLKSQDNVSQYFTLETVVSKSLHNLLFTFKRQQLKPPRITLEQQYSTPSSLLKLLGT